MDQVLPPQRKPLHKLIASAFRILLSEGPRELIVATRNFASPPKAPPFPVRPVIVPRAKLLPLDPARLLPAHGPQIDDPRALLTGYVAHRLMREAQVLAALRAGRASVQTIAESIYDGLDPALMPAAQENVRAHLEKLKAEGIVMDDAGRWELFS